MSAEEEYSRAKLCAWKRIARVSQHSIELRKYMLEKGFSIEMINTIIQECKAQGYLDDQSWVEGFVRREAGRHKSSRAIAYKLKQKGLPSGVINTALELSYGEDVQEETLKDLVAKKVRGVDLTDRRKRDKLIASLCRRGFGLSDILRVLQAPESEE